MLLIIELEMQSLEHLVEDSLVLAEPEAVIKRR